MLTVDIARAPIYALAQDGPHVAWATECDGLDVTAIESNRIVWAERWRGRSSIRALWL